MAASSSPPEPQVATTSAEYVTQLRALRAWAGLTYRQVERLAENAGYALPHSTLASALSRDKLPREDLVIAFVRACGCDDEATAAWVDVRRRLAASAETGAAPAPAEDEPPPEPPREEEPEPVVVESPAEPPVPAGASAGRRRWARNVLVPALTFALGLAAGVWLDGPDEEVGEPEPVAADLSPTPLVASPGRPDAWWTFGDTDPHSARDEGSGRIPLRLGEGVRRHRAGDVTAILMDGRGRALTTKPVVNTDESFSVTAWVRLDHTGEWTVAVSQHDGPYDVFLLGHNRDVNRWGFMTPDDDDGWLNGHAMSKFAPRRGVWTHLAGVYDAAEHRVKLYVNGELSGTSRTHPLRRAQDGLEVGAAAQHGKPLDHWRGAIDDVRLYQGVLTADTVVQVMRARR